MSIWKKLKLDDLKILDAHSKKYDPYCHLNVIDLWAYKVTDNYWLQVGDTIAYKLNDYNDDSLYTTLLGNKDIEKALKLICENTQEGTIKLNCLPNTVMAKIKTKDYVIKFQEDHDNHDYIFDVEKLINFKSEALKSQYKKSKRLIKRHPTLDYKLIDTNDEQNRNNIYEVFHEWVRQTGSSHWQKELRALKRALAIPDNRLVTLGFYENNQLIGYTVNRAEQNGYYQAYFGKADRKYQSLSFFQELSTAQYMHKHFASKYLNLQPDSGIEGLRKYKTSLGPSHKLLKFEVYIDKKKFLKSN